MILDHYMTRADFARLVLQSALFGFEYDWYAIEAELRFEVFAHHRASDDGMPEGKS